MIGVDISDALVRLARTRADEAGAGNVVFVVADAQTDELPGGPFDVATSKFGVMFFADPVGAFTNIRAISARVAGSRSRASRASNAIPSTSAPRSDRS